MLGPWDGSNEQSCYPVSYESTKIRVQDVDISVWMLPDIDADPEKYVEAFHTRLSEILDQFLPLRKTVRKSTDVPWYNAGIKKEEKTTEQGFSPRRTNYEMEKIAGRI